MNLESRTDDIAKVPLRKLERSFNLWPAARQVIWKWHFFPHELLRCLNDAQASVNNAPEPPQDRLTSLRE